MKKSIKEIDEEFKREDDNSLFDSGKELSDSGTISEDNDLPITGSVQLEFAFQQMDRKTYTKTKETNQQGPDMGFSIDTKDQPEVKLTEEDLHSKRTISIN